MNKKTQILIESLTGAISTAAIAIVTFINPACAVALNGSIAIISSAVISIVGLFTKEDK